MPSKIRGGTADKHLADMHIPRMSALGAGGGAAEVAYTLYDAFTTDRAAGAVNGTTSESPYATGGGVTRTVTDTNSKLTIASGLLTFATGGGVGGGNPGLWYAQITRASGLFVVTGVTTGTTTRSGALGWDTAQSGSASDSISFSLSGLLQIVNNTNAVSVGAWATSTAYQGCVILRASGAWYFIKGGAFSNWTLLWAGTVGTGNLYPALVAAWDNDVVTMDNIRVPVATYIPTPLAYDTFTRANGALGSTETTGPDSQVLVAKAWTDQVGTWEIATNVAHASAVTGAIAIATYDGGELDTLHEVKIVRAAGSVGGVIRYADSSNYIRFSHDGTNFVVEKIVAGTPTTVITAVATYSAGAVGRLIMQGTSLQAFYNNVKIGSTSTVSDAALQTSSLVGIYSTDTNAGNTLNDALTWARGSGGEYSQLDSY